MVAISHRDQILPPLAAKVGKYQYYNTNELFFLNKITLKTALKSLILAIVEYSCCIVPDFVLEYVSDIVVAIDIFIAGSIGRSLMKKHQISIVSDPGNAVISYLKIRGCPALQDGRFSIIINVEVIIITVNNSVSFHLKKIRAIRKNFKCRAIFKKHGSFLVDPHKPYLQNQL